MPEVMVKFTRRATGHFVMLSESGMHLNYVYFWTSRYTTTARDI